MLSLTRSLSTHAAVVPCVPNNRTSAGQRRRPSRFSWSSSRHCRETSLLLPMLVSFVTMHTHAHTQKHTSLLAHKIQFCEGGELTPLCSPFPLEAENRTNECRHLPLTIAILSSPLTQLDRRSGCLLLFESAIPWDGTLRHSCVCAGENL